MYVDGLFGFSNERNGVMEIYDRMVGQNRRKYS